MTFIIPIEQLLAARERYEESQAAERRKRLEENKALYDAQQAESKAAQTPVTAEKQPFVYRSRPAEEWEKRAQQGRTPRKTWRRR